MIWCFPINKCTPFGHADKTQLLQLSTFYQHILLKKQGTSDRVAHHLHWQEQEENSKHSNPKPELLPLTRKKVTSITMSAAQWISLFS